MSMIYNRFAASGSLSTGFVFAKMGTNNLRAACSKLGLGAPDVFPNDFYNMPYLGIERLRDVGHASGSFSVSVICYAAFSVSDNASWITVTPTSGSNGVSNLTLSVQQNTGDSRSGSVTITSLGESVSMTVRQAAKPIELKPIYLTYNSSASNICYNSVPRTLYIANNQNFLNATKAYGNAQGNTSPQIGFYMYELNYRYFNGVTFTSSLGQCRYLPPF